MEIRYPEPASEPPSVDNLHNYLRDARPTLRERVEGGKACEARRVKAVDALLTIGRKQIAKTGDPNRLRAMSTELREFLEIEGLRMLLNPDPVGTMRGFLGQRRGRGAPTKDTERRNIWIAAEVQRRRDSGDSVPMACAAITKIKGLSVSAGTARRIYTALCETDEVTLSLITLEEFYKLPHFEPPGEAG